MGGGNENGPSCLCCSECPPLFLFCVASKLSTENTACVFLWIRSLFFSFCHIRRPFFYGFGPCIRLSHLHTRKNTADAVWVQKQHHSCMDSTQQSMHHPASELFWIKNVQPACEHLFFLNHFLPEPWNHKLWHGHCASNNPHKHGNSMVIAWQ